MRYRNEPIRLYKPKRVTQFLNWKDTWDGPNWLKKIFAKFGWVKYDFTTTEDIITLHNLDSDDLLKVVMDEWYSIYDAYNIKCTKILIGEDQWTELTNNKHFNQCVSYTANLKNGDRGEFLGMKIIVIPWMRGWVIC